MEILTTIGVDAHSQVHVAAALDQQGRVIAEQAINATARELDRLVGWVQTLPTPRQVAIEGAKGYGRTLTQGSSRPGRPSWTSRPASPPRDGGGAGGQARTTKATPL